MYIGNRSTDSNFAGLMAVMVAETRSIVLANARASIRTASAASFEDCELSSIARADFDRHTEEL